MARTESDDCGCDDGYVDDPDEYENPDDARCQESNSNEKEEQEMADGKEGVEVSLQRSQSSVMVKRDPKGVLSWEIKVYADTVEEAVAVVQVAKEDLEERIGTGK